MENMEQWSRSRTSGEKIRSNRLKINNDNNNNINIQIRSINVCVN